MKKNNKFVNEPLFPNQDFGRNIYKHNKLPIFITDEFDFFRCVEFNESFYGKNVYELNEGNLRLPYNGSRYSSLFLNQKLSYWADSIETSRKEIKRHGSSNNIITFWAYDDATSTFPILDNQEPLIIIDGRDVGFHEILQKNENNIELNQEEKNIVNEIIKCNPDCLAYYSVANPGAVNYIFFEKGFRKLAIRQVRLRLGNNKSKNTSRIVIADTCDYNAIPKYYGEYFLPIARVGFDDSYLSTEDYKNKCKNKDSSLVAIHTFYKKKKIY
jgi:hypothetical protein